MDLACYHLETIIKNDKKRRQGRPAKWWRDDVSKNLEEGKQTDVLDMDFAKAFDKVCHSLLLHKLDH